MWLAALMGAGGFGLSLYLTMRAVQDAAWGRAMLWLAFLITNAVLFGTAMERILT